MPLQALAVVGLTALAAMAAPALGSKRTWEMLPFLLKNKGSE
jgi:hypothetical protein